MNSLHPYEKQIAGKLEQIPLPELENAIWSSIERMLEATGAADASNQTKENPSHATTTNSISLAGKIITAILIAAVILVICILIIRKPRTKNTPATPSLTAPVSVEKQNSEKKSTVPYLRKQPTAPIDTFLLNETSYQTDPAQTIVPEQSNIRLKNTRIDSLAIKPLPILPPKQEAEIKKSKGVRSISDSDYRFILEKKDTSKHL